MVMEMMRDRGRGHGAAEPQKAAVEGKRQRGDRISMERERERKSGVRGGRWGLLYTYLAAGGWPASEMGQSEESVERSPRSLVHDLPSRLRSMVCFLFGFDPQRAGRASAPSPHNLASKILTPSSSPMSVDISTTVDG